MKKIALAVIVLVSAASPAYAMKHFLVAQYFEGGSQMCKYDNGTVLNVGAQICPLSIEG